ncbi:MAG: ribonuclease H-like domain-containing protein [Eubacterium sp.]|nr:ribonuclease H-like domain-containing protein [Eubacterium sp.]
MKRYEYTYPADLHAMGYVPSDAVFLDIETTGIKKENAIITVIGCGYIAGKNLHILQWFNDDAVSEESMLGELESFLSSRSFTLVTYNGDYFDLPFLRAHYYYNGLSPEINRHPVLDKGSAIDLFQELRCYAPLFPDGRTKQKTLEKYLGIDREDIYSGGELISLYRDYLKTKGQEKISVILLHNREDILYLSSIPSLLVFHQLKEGDFTIESLEESIYQDRTALRFLCRLKRPLPRPFSLATDLAGMELVSSGPSSHMDMAESDSWLSVTVPVWERKMYHFYKDYKDYYYLPSEDRAIHKSVGIYVEKDHRCKATPENCYYSTDSVFLPLPGSAKAYGFRIDVEDRISLPVFRRTYKDKKHFLNFDDLFLNQESRDIARIYLTLIIRSILLEKNRELKKTCRYKKDKTK